MSSYESIIIKRSFLCFCDPWFADLGRYLLYPFQILRIFRLIRHRNEVFLLVVQAAYRLDMHWDDGVNKKAHIHAVATTLDVRNMPLTGFVRAPGSVSLSRQTGICRYRLTTYSASASAISKCPGSCCVCSICPFFFLSVHSGASSRSPLVKNMYTSSPRKSQTA